MKKKLIISTVLLIGIIFTSFINVYAYSPHYLPGGKNYLSDDNFIYDDTDYITEEAFLVKTYTDYVLTIPIEYAYETWNSIVLYLRDDQTKIETLVIEPDEMTYFDDGVDKWFYYTFKTTANTNYLEVAFDNTYDYFDIYPGVDKFQLEEGLVFSGYEVYIEGSLIDTSAPYFQNANTVISYFDSPITVLEIQSALQAYDDIDGDVTSSIELITDNYTPNIDVLGVYNIIFEVSDSSSNTSQISLDVEVVDVLEPIFTNLDTIQAVYPNVYTVSDILNLLSASDNYDGDISNNIVLENDGYTTNSSLVGLYEMEFSVTDSSGNMGVYIQRVQVVDNEGPIFQGISTISIGYDQILTPDSIGDNLSFTDNYDLEENLVLDIDFDDYTGNEGIVGNYQIVYSVTDSSGNKSTHTVGIDVVDQMGPVVYFNSSIIQTYSDSVMALPDFVQLLKSTEEIDKYKDYYVTVRYDSYTNNAEKPGTYHLSLDLTDNQGQAISKDFEVRVIERPYDYVEMGAVDEDVSVFQKYTEYFIGGASAAVLVVSNVIWVVVLKKKK